MIASRAIMAALSGAAFFVAPALADPPELHLPIDCTLGRDCMIQQYMDRDPGPEARDYTCGPLSYDGHSGTDFRLVDRAALARDVAVLAAASGIVTGLRNTAPDTGRDGMTAGQECGNGVVLDHGDGWQSQYCHLRQGSVLVEQGDMVAAGDALGLVGYSGNTQFPHLHLSLRHEGAHVDPFSDAQACGVAGASLWATSLPYQPGGLLSAGFASDIPEFDTIQAGEAHATTLPADSPALVLWAYLFGAEAGDEVRLTIETPEAETLHDVTVPLDRRQAQLFRATGLRARQGGWPAGVYRGTVQFRRDGQVIDNRGTVVTIAP